MVAVAHRELDMHTVSVATPVFGGHGGVIAALGLGLSDRPVNLDVVKPALMVAARCLSRELRSSHYWVDGTEEAVGYWRADTPRAGRAATSA